MALIQINVPDDVKARADAAFARNGITTPAAVNAATAADPTHKRITAEINQPKING